MRPTTELPSRNWRRPFGLLLVAGLVVGACSGAGATTAATAAATPAATPAATAAPTPTPVPSPTKGPANAQIALAGDPALATLSPTVAIQCNFPSVTGPLIILTEQASPNGLAVRVVLSPGQLSVRYAFGSGKTYLDREFTGTGITGFDAATGAQFDSSLSTAPYAGATGNLGTITSIKGSVDCGSQTAGASTLTITGATDEGQLNGIVLNPVRVQCTTISQANYVSAVGVAQVGSVPTLFFVSGSPTGFTVAQEPQTGGVAFYTNKTPAAVAVTVTGMHVSGDATEAPAAGKTAHTVTVTGDATCGTP
jgi:hypothetical protein